MPHSSTSIPAPVRAGIVLDDEALAVELAAITDADTHLIAEGAADAAGVRPWIFVNRASLGRSRRCLPGQRLMAHCPKVRKTHDKEQPRRSEAVIEIVDAYA